MKTKLKDSVLDFEAVGPATIPVTNETFIAIIQAIGSLNDTCPMESYLVTRDGQNDVWNIEAHIVDGRTYTSTLTITDGVPRYTVTVLPASLAPEVAAFLQLIEVLAKVVKLYELSSIEISWAASEP